MINWGYDIECFRHFWCVCFEDIDDENNTYVVLNDAEELNDFMNRYDESCFFGFNSLNYDKNMLRAMRAGWDNQSLKELNDWIVGQHERAWDFPGFDELRSPYHFDVDIRNDMYKGLSLKSIEGHLGLPIRESSVPFELDRPLTQAEIEQVVKYCQWDTHLVCVIKHLRDDYFNTKINLGKRVDIRPQISLSMTNAKLTAKLLGAKYVERTDGREYRFPDEVDFADIPDEVAEFFSTIWYPEIPDDVLFKSSLVIDLWGMMVKFAWGGVHGSKEQYFEEETEERILQIRDVMSLYPTLCERYRYLSRNVPDPTLYSSLREERITAKNTGDEQTSKDLKLPLNTVTGAQENAYNDLYDPLPTRSLRITGQLLMCMLAARLVREVPSIILNNVNTDGIAYSAKRSELPIIDRVCSQWEKETHFELETEDIQKMYIKDVNNLLLVKKTGKVKAIGGYLKTGISSNGAWSINNNMVVVANALKEYMINGTPVRDTILAETDLTKFQIIGGGGKDFLESYHIVDSQPIPCNKVNRVFAYPDTSYGTVYKKTTKGKITKVPGFPAHCILDNELTAVTLDKIDKQWYIDTAESRLEDFLGTANQELPLEKLLSTKEG